MRGALSKHNAGVRGDRPAVEISGDLLAAAHRHVTTDAPALANIGACDGIRLSKDAMNASELSTKNIEQGYFL